MVGFPQAWQTLNPINPSANPSLISLDVGTPKVIITAKTAFPFGADHQNELPKAVIWTSGTVRFKSDDGSPMAMPSAVFRNTGHYFVVSNDIFWQQPLLSFCAGMEKCIIPPLSGNPSNTATRFSSARSRNAPLSLDKELSLSLVKKPRWSNWTFLQTTGVSTLEVIMTVTDNHYWRSRVKHFLKCC